MKILIVRAHPLDAERSLTTKIADFFADIYQEKHPDCEITKLNLYEDNVPEIDQPLLTAWSALAHDFSFNDLTVQQQLDLNAMEKYLQQFLAHDKIVIVNPLWNLSIPTKLHAWFNTIIVPNKTVLFTEEGPVGLMQGKKVLHIQTSADIYHNEDPASKYVKTICQYIGITDFQQVAIEGISTLVDERAEILAQAKEDLGQIAEIF